MKKFLLSLTVAAVACATVFAGGCFVTSGVDGANGKDGQNASAYQYYELAKSEGLVSSLDEFLTKYLNYTPDELEEAFSLQRAMNKSLLSGVTIAATFSSGTAFGSGVIVDLNKNTGDAYIVTNCHVVYNDSSAEIYSKNIYCYLYGQDGDYNSKENRFKASIVAASIKYDIALLKVDGGKNSSEASFSLKNSNAVAAKFVDSDDVYVGEQVFAVGNAEGQGMSATRGVITKEREVVSLNLSTRYPKDSRYYNDYNVIRTDAAINEGNSGGALFNRGGEIVAIVNAKASSTLSGTSVNVVESMGYALPASNVRRLVSLMSDGYKGTMLTDATLLSAHLSAEIKATAMPSYWNEEEGRTEIRERVSVEKKNGDLAIGDTINKIKICDAQGNTVEEREVTRLYHVEDALLSVRNGYKVYLTVSRGGEKKEVQANVTFKTFK